jgi:hypothetical protein
MCLGAADNALVNFLLFCCHADEGEVVVMVMGDCPQVMTLPDNHHDAQDLAFLQVALYSRKVAITSVPHIGHVKEPFFTTSSCSISSLSAFSP